MSIWEALQYIYGEKRATPETVLRAWKLLVKMDLVAYLGQDLCEQADLLIEKGLIDHPYYVRKN